MVSVISMKSVSFSDEHYPNWNTKGAELHLILFSLQFSESVRSTAWKNVFLKTCVPYHVEQFDIVVMTQRILGFRAQKFFLNNFYLGPDFFLQTRKL